MDDAPTVWQQQPPWMQGRPRRSSAERRAQARRAEGRTCQSLLKAFAELWGHRGGQPTQLGTALAEAPKATRGSATSDSDKGDLYPDRGLSGQRQSDGDI